MEDEIKEKELQEEIKEEEKEPEKPLDKMTATQLREVALGIPGISGAHAMKKEELLKAIKEARGIKEEAPEKKKRVKKEVTVAGLKKKIVQLKQEKTAARESNDKKKVNIYRRRINRLKKRARRVA